MASGDNSLPHDQAIELETIEVITTSTPEINSTKSGNSKDYGGRVNQQSSPNNQVAAAAAAVVASVSDSSSLPSSSGCIQKEEPCNAEANSSFAAATAAAAAAVTTINTDDDYGDCDAQATTIASNRIRSDSIDENAISTITPAVCAIEGVPEVNATSTSVAGATATAAAIAQTVVTVARSVSDREKKIGHRRVGQGGEITYKKIQSTQIMGSIQLGIQQAVGGLASKPERDLLMQDFMTLESTTFPTLGSNQTPGHHYSEFKFKTYAPIAFRYFRDLFGIQPEDFLISMCSYPLRELSNPGASGSIFYLTEDDEFIVKTVQHKEGDFLQKLLPGYYMNLNQNPRTLLPKFFGLYCYQCNHKNVRLVVMNNILPSGVRLHQKYDLKGSTYKRKASKAEKQKKSPTFKDLDFLEHHPDGLFLESETYNALIKTIQRDCRVLQSFKIMDYSLLLGIHNLDYREKKSRNMTGAERSRESSCAEDVESPSLSNNEPTDVAPGTSYAQTADTCAGSGDEDGADYDESIDAIATTSVLNRTRSITRQRLVAHSTAMESIQAEADPIDHEENIPSGGIPARSSKGERLIVYVGIIDILQSYRLKKKLEHTLKSMIHDGDTVSVHRPGFYAQRFQNFMEKRVFKKIPSPLKHSPSKRKSLINRQLRLIGNNSLAFNESGNGGSSSGGAGGNGGSNGVGGVVASTIDNKNGQFKNVAHNSDGYKIDDVHSYHLRHHPMMMSSGGGGTATELVSCAGQVTVGGSGGGGGDSLVITAGNSITTATNASYPAVLLRRPVAADGVGATSSSSKVPPPVPPRGSRRSSSSSASASSSRYHHRNNQQPQLQQFSKKGNGAQQQMPSCSSTPPPTFAEATIDQLDCSNATNSRSLTSAIKTSTGPRHSYRYNYQNMSGQQSTKSSLSISSSSGTSSSRGMIWTPPRSVEGSTPTWTEGTPSFTDSSSSNGGETKYPTSTPKKHITNIQIPNEEATVVRAISCLTTEMKQLKSRVENDFENDIRTDTNADIEKDTNSCADNRQD